MSKEEIKTLEQMKKEFGDKFDIIMYDMNLELINKLTQANSKIEKIRECAKNRLKHNEDYIKTESEDANLIYILSIIGEK